MNVPIRLIRYSTALPGGARHCLAVTRFFLPGTCSGEGSAKKSGFEGEGQGESRVGAGSRRGEGEGESGFSESGGGKTVYPADKLRALVIARVPVRALC